MANHQHIEWLLEGLQSWNARRDRDPFTPDFSGVDVYEVFRKEDKLNSAGNIPFAGFNLRHAIFANARLSTPYSAGSADFRKTNLWSADLRGATLTNAHLDKAVVRSAKLDGANLSGASLRRCKLTNTSFIETELFQADLTNADLRGAYLKKANLSLAILNNADLTNAVLTGSDLSSSQPWKAKLYERDDFKVDLPKAAHGTHIQSIADLTRECAKLQTNNGAGRQLYFRGESNNQWPLRPSVMRQDADGVARLRAHEGEMLLDLISQRPEDFAGATTALSQWVLAQHHGLKTRLLDVTRNPLVALLGACGGLDDDRAKQSARDGRLHAFAVPREMIKPFTSDTITVIANVAKLSRSEQDCLLGWTIDDRTRRTPAAPIEHRHEHVMQRLYHQIRQERPHFAERIEQRDFWRVFVVNPLQSFERIRAQSGAFLISAFHERFERNKVLKWNEQVPLYDHVSLDVPNQIKQQLIDELRLLGVAREFLLPGLDEAAKAITQRHTNPSDG